MMKRICLMSLTIITLLFSGVVEGPAWALAPEDEGRISSMATGTVAEISMVGSLMSEDHNPFVAHDHESSFFLGGVLSVWYDTDRKVTSLDLHPEVGYFLNKDWAIGLMLGYGIHEHDAVKESHLRISPFVRYYYLHRGPFNLYLDGGFGYNIAKVGGATNKGYEIGLRPGACLDLVEGLCLCLRMGFIGYRNNFFSGEEPGVPQNGFGLHFAPEELMIGLELEF